ncbi:MAG: FAD-dependent oxidoreductase [Candidatus Anstonellales archaeon]
MQAKALEVLFESGYLYLKVEKVCEYRAGQYFVVEYKGIKRPYSAASSPLEESILFLVKLGLGEMSNALRSIKAGDIVGIEGPFGDFVYGGSRQAFFAAGSGIAPIRGIVKDMELRGVGKGTIFYSCREGYFPFKEELLGLKRSRVVLTVTGSAPEGWEYEKGRINAALVAKHKDSWDIAYICGPVGFAKSMKEIAESEGVKELRIEAWG